MEDRNRLRTEALIRIKAILDENAGDFAAVPVAVAQHAAINNEIANISLSAAEQQTGKSSAHAAQAVKATARENLRDEVSAIYNLARAMEYEFDGFSEIFAFRRNLGDQELLAVARSFYTQSAAHEADFIRYGLPATFRDDLQAAITAFDASVLAAATRVGERIEAGTDYGSSVRRGMIAKRILNSVMPIVYANEPGKLAAWRSASHVEKPPTKKEQPAPPSPPTPTPTPTPEED